MSRRRADVKSPARLPRLTIFSAAWQPVEGGAERQMREVAERLARRSWDVSVITGTREASATSKQLRILGPGTSRNPSQSNTSAGLPLLTASLSRGLQTQPDVILGSLVSASTLAAVTLGRLLGRPVVLRLGGHGFEPLARSTASIWRGRYILTGCSLVVVNASHLLEQLQPFGQRYLPPTALIPNGVDLRLRETSVPDSDSTGGRRKRVLFYTNGGWPKNDPGFLDIVEDSPDIQFRAIGHTDHLRQLPNLECVGWRDDVAADIEWADNLLNTSFVEGSPNFCLQGLAMGKPVVGYANDGLLELRDSYPDAVLVASHGDRRTIRDLLAHGVGELVLDPPKIPTLDDAAEEWDAILRSVLNAHRMQGRTRWARSAGSVGSAGHD